jgi:hypothetical protein
MRSTKGEEMGIEVLKKIFGEQFVEQYQRALAKAQEIPQAKLEAIEKFALEALKSNPEEARVKYNNLDVLLVQTANDPKKFPVIKTSSGNYKVGMVWAGSRSMRGPFISVFCADKELAEKLASTPGKVWLIVGKLQERSFEGDTTYAFRVQGAIPLGE